MFFRAVAGERRLVSAHCRNFASGFVPPVLLRKLHAIIWVRTAVRKTMTLNFKSQDGPARNAGCGSRNGRGNSRCCGRGRSAAFPPLQRGQPFGVRCLLTVRESKRHKCRAPISNFGRRGMGRWLREFSGAGRNCTGQNGGAVQKRCRNGAVLGFRWGRPAPARRGPIVPGQNVAGALRSGCVSIALIRMQLRRRA